jgi:hypothetical protein
MLTLVSYPDLFGVADNNPYGLKVFAFLKLCRLPFRHEHILDAKDAPRGQLPFIVDGAETIGDSDAIISHLVKRYALPIDDGLTVSQRNTDLLVRRMLDDLYWVMSFSRWKDPRFWPLFKDALLRTHAGITSEGLERARDYNFKRYHYQGIGRYEPDAVYAKGIADLAGEPPSYERLSVRRQAEKHRCGNLRVHRQYPFLRDRHAAEGLSYVAAKHRGALPVSARRTDGMSGLATSGEPQARRFIRLRCPTL